MDISPNFDYYIESLFPKITQEGYKLTSPKTPDYNCIAWAASCNNRWWWPNSQTYYWPEDISQTCTIESFIEAYKTLGYDICSDDKLEVNFEKVAIFTNDLNIPTHAARQLNNGKWTSKLGSYKDIEHGLYGIESIKYGKVSVILKKPINK